MMRLCQQPSFLISGDSIYGKEEDQISAVNKHNNSVSVGFADVQYRQIRPASNNGNTNDLGELLDHLESLRRQRLPLVNTACDCEQTRPCTKSVVNVNSDSSSSSEDDESDIRISDILRTVELYKKKNDCKKINSVKTLISSYSCKEDVNDGTVQQIYKYIDSEEEEIAEIGWLVLQQISASENNVFKLLFHDIIIKTFETLFDQNKARMHEAAALTLEKVVICEDFSELWMEFMMSEGLSRIVALCCLPHSSAVRLAAATVLRSLATYKDMAVLLIDQGLEPLVRLKDLNSKCQEVFTGTMINLLAHTDYTRQSVLDVDALPTALHMLQQGLCTVQHQALVLIDAVSQSEYGLKALLEAGLIPYVMSALVDSQCRKVRGTAIACVSSITNIRKSSFQKQVLVQIDKFYHEHEEEYADNIVMNTSSKSPQSKLPVDNRHINTASKVQRAITDLSDTIVRNLEKAARMDKDSQGKVIQVHLAPCIDIDVNLLRLLGDLVCTIGNLTHFKLSRSRCKSSSEGRKEDKVYPHAAKILVEQGALCMLDLLHVYASKWDHTHVAARSYKCEAWTQPNTQSSVTSLAQIFEKSEISLIHILLDTIHKLARCSCEDQAKEDVLSIVEQQMQCRVSSPDHSPSGRKAKRVSSKSPGRCESVDTTGEHKKDDKILKELQSIRRHLRIALFNAGLVQAVAPFLHIAVDEENVKVRIYGILRCFIADVTEKPGLSSRTTPSSRSHKRPQSAMTHKEREHRFNLARLKMSAGTVAAIDEAMTDHQNKNSDVHASTETSQLPGDLNKPCGNVSNLTDKMESRPKDANNPSSVFSFLRDITYGNKEVHFEGTPHPRSPMTKYEQYYEKFERLPSRPTSAKVEISRPGSAKNAVIQSRPPSARDYQRPHSAKSICLSSTYYSKENHIENSSLETEKQNDNSSCRPRSTQSERSNKHQMQTKNDAADYTVMKTRPPSGKRAQSAGGNIGNRKSNSASSCNKEIVTSGAQRKASSRPSSGVTAAVKQLEKLSPLPWKPNLDLLQPVLSQCQWSVVDVCCKPIIQDLLSKNQKSRREALSFLYDFISLCDRSIHMGLSECGLIKTLVDLLRISDEETVVEIAALKMASLLLQSDIRLNQLFQQYHLNQLLLNLASTASGMLRVQVLDTLKFLTKQLPKTGPKCNRRWSAPPGSRKQAPDVWDKIMLRWQEEDRVMFLLRKYND